MYVDPAGNNDPITGNDDACNDKLVKEEYIAERDVPIGKSIMKAKEDSVACATR